MIETSGHLPECDDWRIGARRGVRACICPWLRACEARVRHEPVGSCIKHYDAGYAAALDAARDAVAAQDPRWSVDYADAIRDALAAIDALRGES